ARRRSAKGAFDHAYKMLQFFASVIAQVIEPKGRCIREINGRRRETRHNASNNVVNVRKVAPHLTIIVQLDRLALDDRFGEEPSGHIGSAPRSIDGKEAQPSNRQPEKVRIAI